MSVQEVRLWVRLRALRAEGYHFRRQAPLLGYYPDFLCLGRRLVVEVDEPHHREPEQAPTMPNVTKPFIAPASTPCDSGPRRCMRISKPSWT